MRKEIKEKRGLLFIALASPHFRISEDVSHTFGIANMSKTI